ncbi:hypothetical protein N9772_00620 [Bacteroidia bacterium]|nr:hypothetical protein [Bacteroidia bacterium]
MNLAKEISFLLYKHNCVILPGFGAFLLREKNAERNEVAKYAMPKQKTVTFNQQIVNNDGLVANYVSTQNNCSYESGLEKINDYTNELWDTLKSKRNVEVADVGTFYYTQEDKLVFVPYHSVNFDTASFGLPKLRLKTVELAITPAPIAHQDATTEVLAPAKVEEPTVESPMVREVVTKVAAAKAKTKQRNVKIQAKKLQTKTKQGTTKSRFSGLAVVNTLGLCFLIGMAFALLNFEQSQSNRQVADQQVASILNAPDNPTYINTATEASFGIYAHVVDHNEAIELTESLQDKYDNTEITPDSNNETTVFIISFHNEELAHEYKNLLQNKLDLNLIVKQK